MAVQAVGMEEDRVVEVAVVAIESLFTYGLLFLSVLLLWAPRVKNIPLWMLAFYPAVIVGLIAGHLTPMFLISFGLMHLAINLLLRDHRKSGGALLLIVGVGLGAHLFPGYANLRVLDQVQISSDGIPFTLYLNFDKTMIGLFILGLLHPLLRRGTDWLQMLRVTSRWAPPLIALLALLSILLGFVHYDPKLPPSLPIWAATNLLLVCVAEEAFFRGFIQRQLADRLHPGLALAIAGILFGIAHWGGGPKYVLLASLAGCGYGWIYHLTKRIEASILTHFLLNLTHFLLLTYPALPPH